MNVLYLERLADFIESAPKTHGLGFSVASDYSRPHSDQFSPDMSGYRLKVVGDVIDHAMIMDHGLDGSKWPAHSAFMEFMERSGLDERQCLHLWLALADQEVSAFGVRWAMREYTPTHTINTIRHLIKTGRVDWREANPGWNEPRKV